MLILDKNQLAEFLTKISSALDIPDHLYEDAILKYEDIGMWLAADDPELKRYSPEIYPQGSFRLGTVVRPISEKDEYDIDLVCHLQLQKEQTTQKNLKELVGNRLKKRGDIAQILSPSRRCWSLDYPNHFHMDVLPAIPNRERPPTGVLLTDTELTRWQKSNPKAYAEWFYKRMEFVLQEMRKALAESTHVDIEAVPEWRVKTPLQRTIQLLKRHRDVHFSEDQDNKPVSIIITTLATWAYRNQANIYDALSDIVRDMSSFIENREGRWWVMNPVDPDENFADKWNENPKRKEAFFAWIKKVSGDFSNVSQKKTLLEATELLAPTFGRGAMAKVAKDLGFSLIPALPLIVTPEPRVPALSDTQHCQSLVWPERSIYTAKVVGTVHFNKGSQKKLWDLTNDRPVPKKVWLRFKVTTDAPTPYEVQWQVVNTGKEAVEAKQLRGDFYASDVPNAGVRWESTAYAGTHWVEAFIVKNDICVSRSGRKYVKIR